MGTRYGWGGDQWFDDNGRPLAGGKLYFYLSGTVTDKGTYSDEDESILNTNPVILDAAGRQGDIFFTGQAKVVITDANGVQIDVTDPVGTAAGEAAFGTWSATINFGLNAIVTGSNGLYYKSVTGSNYGNDPISSPAYWMEVRFLNVYNASYSYFTDDVAEYGGTLWISLSSGNLGHTPAANSTYWRSLSSVLAVDYTPKTADFNAAAGTHYLIDTATGGTFTMTLPASPAVGDAVGFTDYAGGFAGDNLLIGRNGSEIMNSATDLICNIDYFSGVLVYSGATRGWIFK